MIPYFLTLGLHMERDLPKLAEAIARKHPDLAITVTAPLDGHPALVEILLDRASDAIVELTPEAVRREAPGN